MLFSPEHGIRGTEDRQNISNDVDTKTGLPIYSLYASQTVPPPDSLLRKLDVLVVDLQDIGTRTWTYVGAMVYSMRAAARTGKQIIVLDRPNPITGFFVEGPVLDSTLANANDPAPGRPGQAYALYPMPLRHGMTMAEMALFFNDALNIHANLKVVPMNGWRRELWFDRTGLPWVKPSPEHAVASERDSVSRTRRVSKEPICPSGAGRQSRFQVIGAPWLKARETVALLKDREIKGVRFYEETFTPIAPTDGKYSGRPFPESGSRLRIAASSSRREWARRFYGRLRRRRATASRSTIACSTCVSAQRACVRRSFAATIPTE